MTARPSLPLGPLGPLKQRRPCIPIQQQAGNALTRHFLPLKGRGRKWRTGKARRRQPGTPAPLRRLLAALHTSAAQRTHYRVQKVKAYAYVRLAEGKPRRCWKHQLHPHTAATFTHTQPQAVGPRTPHTHVLVTQLPKAAKPQRLTPHDRSLPAAAVTQQPNAPVVTAHPSRQQDGVQAPAPSKRKRLKAAINTEPLLPQDKPKAHTETQQPHAPTEAQQPGGPTLVQQQPQGPAEAQQPHTGPAAPPAAPMTAPQPPDAAGRNACHSTPFAVHLLHGKVVTIPRDSRQPCALLVARGQHGAFVRKLLGKGTPPGDKHLATITHGHLTHQVFGRDMQRLLKPNGWLNDEAINFWMHMIQARNDNYYRDLASRQHPHSNVPSTAPTTHVSKQSKVPRIYVLSSFFWTQLTLPQGRVPPSSTATPPNQAHNQHQQQQTHGPVKTGKRQRPCTQPYQYSNVQRWTRPARTHTPDCVLWRDLILIPVNHNLHWCLAAVHPHRQLIELYDSMAPTPTSQRILDTLQRWYQQDCLDKAEYAPAGTALPHHIGPGAGGTALPHHTGPGAAAQPGRCGDTAGAHHVSSGQLPGQACLNPQQTGRQQLQGPAAGCSVPEVWPVQPAHATRPVQPSSKARQAGQLSQPGLPGPACERTDRKTGLAGGFLALQQQRFKQQVVVEGVPRQGDGSACGVFTCAFAELLSRGVRPPFAFAQASVGPYLAVAEATVIMPLP